MTRYTSPEQREKDTNTEYKSNGWLWIFFDEQQKCACN